MIAGPTEFQRARAGLIAVAFLAPFSATRLVASLTLGRAAALAFAGLLAADLLGRRPADLRFDLPAIMLGAAYLGLAAWIFLSSVAWGCNCDGKAGGFYEVATVGLLVLVAIRFEPRLREVAIVAALGGIVFAAILAFLGVGSINSGTVDLTQTGGRLSGTFGNANELGFSAALGIPIALAYVTLVGRRERIAATGATLILAVTLVLTFSRGAIVAAAVGAFALALLQARGSRHRVAIVLGVTAAAVLVAAALYAVFEEERRDASFGSVSPDLRVLDQRDLSGWDSRALGPIPSGPSQLLDEGSAIAVRTSRAGEGVSYRWGEANVGGAYMLSFRARAQSDGLPFSYSLGDSAQRLGGRVATGTLERRWRRFSLDWHPLRRAPHATLFLWQRAGPSTFALSDVRVVAREQGSATRAITVPGNLEGSLYDRLASRASREEQRYIQSRLDAAELAIRAFGSEPLLGIGWSTFPDYSAARLDYGALAAHNEYLSFAAELGIVGVILLALLIAAVVLGFRGARPGRPEDAAIGVLAAAAAGLVFVEALPIPQLSISIALAAAIVCGRPRRSGVG